MTYRIPFALSLLAASLAHAYEADKTYHFTILHTNDLHGHFAANAQGEGGYAAQKTLIDQVRKEVAGKGGELLILNAGDVNTGTPESDMQDALPDIEAMNVMGYEAMALGNHEFDNPDKVLQQQRQLAHFPFLSANVYRKSDNQYLVEPYKIFDKGGLKIGVMGLTTEDTAKLGNPEYMQATTFTLPKDAAAEVLKRWAEEEKPDVKIALTHLGYYPNGEHGSNAPGDVSLARALEKDALDMIIGGHSHDTVCVHEDGSFNDEYQPGDACMPDFQNGIWIMQAGEWGKYLGRADFSFKNGDLKLESYRLIPVNLKKKVKRDDGKSDYVLYEEEIAANAEINALLDPYIKKGEALLGEKIGTVDGELDGQREHVRFFQTNFGRLIAEAQRERAQADIAIMNSGGIRASIAAGDITYKDVLTVQPFANTVTSVELSGEELQQYLSVVGIKSVDSGAYPQYSAGLSMTVDYEGQQVKDVKIHGEPLDANKIYRVSIPNYVAAGGDGYPLMTQHPTFVDTGFVDAEVLKAYLASHSPLKVADYEPKGEIVFLAAPAPAK